MFEKGNQKPKKKTRKERLENRILFLPNHTLNELRRLAGLEVEVEGVLFYGKQKEKNTLRYEVYTGFITGVGDKKGIISIEDRIKMVNEILRIYKPIKYIYFHTYPEGRIEILVPKNTKGSPQYDLKEIKKALRENKGLKISITPDIKLPTRVGNLNLVTDSLSKDSKKDEEISERIVREMIEYKLYEMLGYIAERFSYKMERLPKADSVYF